MDLQLQDKVFIITGGSAGLGFATAQALVDEGAGVVLSSRSQEAVESAAAELGPSAIGIAADNADPETPQRLIEAANAAFGRIDGALISVGGPPSSTGMGASASQWEESVNSILLGGIRLASAISAELLEGGSLAFVLSTSVKTPIPGLAISNALRPALGMYAKTLADELGPRGIRVNGLLPGRISTGRLQYLDSLNTDPQAAREQNCSTIPLRRYGTPAEFARVASFVLSPAASYISGAMIPVDGGAMRAL